MYKNIIRLLTLIVCFLSFVGSVSAVSLSELQSSSQYVRVGSMNDGDAYLNVNSIQSLRYAPPFYTLKYTVYYVSYSDDLIVESEEISSYDYNYSYEGLIKKHNLTKSGSEQKLKSDITKLKQQNSGIEGGSRYLRIYDVNGNLLDDFSDQYGGYEPNKNSFLTIGYDIVEAAFYKAYNLRF